MLFENNSKNVIDLLKNVDYLKEIEKVKLAKNILEYNPTILNDSKIINVLNYVLSELDSSKKIVNFSKYVNLNLISARFMELCRIEQKSFIIELLFNIYETNFNNELINDFINQNLDIYNISYNNLYA